MTKTDLNRAIISWGFFAAVLGCVVALLIGVAGQLIPMFSADMGMEGGAAGVLLMPGQHSALMQAALSSRLMLMAVPILCALPYTAAFIDDHRSGLMKMYLPRCGKQAYIKGKVLATGLSGGLALVAGILIAYFITWLVTLPMQMAADPMMAEMGMRPEPTLAPVLQKALLFFVCGGLWATVGGLFASITMNKYMAYASPFIFYYLLVILCERYVKNVYVLNPHEWLNMQNFWPGGEWGIIAMLAVYLLAMALIYSITIARRLRDDR